MVRIINCNSLKDIKTLPDNSVQMCVTSPPYWGLRDYSLCNCAIKRSSEFEASNLTGGQFDPADKRCRLQPRSDCLKCGGTGKIIGTEDQIGLESTPEEYIDKISTVFREIKRILRPDGILWLNLGDSRAGSGGEHTDNSGQSGIGVKDRGRVGVGIGQKKISNLKPKDMIGIPWRVAFALQAGYSKCKICGKELRTDLWPVWEGIRSCPNCKITDYDSLIETEKGWYLRQDVIWSKPNAMPESVNDRCTQAHEYIFLLSKSRKYFYDNEAVKEIAEYDGRKDTRMKGSAKYADGFNPVDSFQSIEIVGHERWEKNEFGEYLKNRRSVWTVPTKAYNEAHFATYPEKLVEICVKAGTSEKGCCSICGAPWERVVERMTPTSKSNYGELNNIAKSKGMLGSGGRSRSGLDQKSEEEKNATYKTVGWKQTCKCQGGKIYQCTVIDPFGGAGTTALVANKLSRNAISLEVNKQYCQIQYDRIAEDIGLFVDNIDKHIRIEGIQ